MIDALPAPLRARIAEAVLKRVIRPTSMSVEWVFDAQHKVTSSSGDAAKMWDGLMMQVEYIVNDLVRHREAAERQCAALRGYAKHLPTCGQGRFNATELDIGEWDSGDCTCGLTALLGEIRQQTEEQRNDQPQTDTSERDDCECVCHASAIQVACSHEGCNGEQRVREMVPMLSSGVLGVDPLRALVDAAFERCLIALQMSPIIPPNPDIPSKIGMAREDVSAAFYTLQADLEALLSSRGAPPR